MNDTTATQGIDRIYLVSLEESSWTDSFSKCARDSYDVTPLHPRQLPLRPSSDAPTKGVVVFYGDDSGRPDTRWVEGIRECVHCIDLPLIAVSQAVSPTVRVQLLTAGASAVCSAGEDPERVLREVENRCNLEPVMEELRRDLLDPFITAAQHTFSEMVRTEARVHSLYRKMGYRIFGDHSAILGIAAASQGTLVLSFPRETSFAVTNRMLEHLGVAASEEVVQSCIAELTNIAVGIAKGALADTAYHFAMATPTVVSGVNHEIRYRPGLPCLVASFTSDIGDFALQLCMEL